MNATDTDNLDIIQTIANGAQLTFGRVTRVDQYKRVYVTFSGEGMPRLNGKKVFFTWDGTGYKRQGQYLRTKDVAK